MNDTITRECLPVRQRLAHVQQKFGIHFPLMLEPTIFNFASQLSPDYHGGHWEFYRLSNGAFYMAPDIEARFAVVCMNGYRGELSADALGITACLYAYSHIAFGGGAIAAVCADQYHPLRDYMLGHREASAILAAID